MWKKTFEVRGSRVIPQLTSSKVKNKIKEGPNPRDGRAKSRDGRANPGKGTAKSREGRDNPEKEGTTRGEGRDNPEKEGTTLLTFSDVKKYKILKLS